jgi:hypothetical protein
MIYSDELEINEATVSDLSATYLDILLDIKNGRQTITL